MQDDYFSAQISVYRYTIGSGIRELMQSRDYSSDIPVLL